jgi:hypothetical protein
MTFDIIFASTYMFKQSVKMRLDNMALCRWKEPMTIQMQHLRKISRCS